MKVPVELHNGHQSQIYIDIENVVDSLIHLTDNHYHINGYYLIGLNNDGMFLIGDIGETDNRSDYIESIDLNEDCKLRIIGVDVI
jgi:hypothetical protein